MHCIIGCYLIQYQSQPNAGQMKPLPEMQFIKSISQYKCQFSIEQALPLSSFSSLSLWSKYPRSGGEAWLCAPDGIFQSNSAGWGRGLLLLSHPTWPRATLPKSREGTASKVKPPHPADILSSFVEIGPSHLTYLHLKPFSGPLPDNQPAQVTPASQGFTGAFFHTLVLVHPRNLGYMQVAPSHFCIACPKVMPAAPQKLGSCLHLQTTQPTQAKAHWLQQESSIAN